MNVRASSRLFAFALVASLGASHSSAQDSPNPEDASGVPQPARNAARLGGPTSVQEELAEDRIDTRNAGLDRWNLWKEELEDRYGFSFSFEYNTLVQGYSDPGLPGDDWAAGGNARMFGSWTLVGRGTENHGSFVFRVDNRHRYTDFSPQDAGLVAGSNSLTGSLFPGREWGLVNLQWSQAILDGKGGFIFGLSPADDYFHAYGLANPLTAFSNLAFSIGGEIAIPDTGLALAGGTMLGEHFYWKGGVHDANGSASDPNLDVIGDWELYKNLEIGWTSGHDKLYLDNFHVGAWHADQRTEAGVPESWGLVGNASWYFDDARLLPFLRGGWSEGGATLLDAQISGGIGRQMRARDLFGVGVSWGSPSSDTQPDQWTAEVFYRIQMGNLAITPSLQVITDPASNPDEDALLVGGLRARIVF